MALQRKTKVIWISLIGAWLVLTVAGLVFTDNIASFAAAKVLASKGYQCNGVQVHVVLGVPPHLAILQPTKCGVIAGPVETIEFKSAVHVHLSKMKPVLITIDSIAIDMRPRPHKEVKENVLGDLAKLAGGTEPAVELMFDSAELSKDKNPPVLAKRAVVTRGGAPVCTFHEMRVTSTAEGMIVTSPEIHAAQAALLGAGVLKMTATPDSSTVNVQFKPDLKVKIDLQGIHEEKPHVAFSIGDAKLGPQPDKAKAEADDKAKEAAKNDKPADAKSK